MEVSWCGGAPKGPKSSIWIGLSITNQPVIGIPHDYGTPHLYTEYMYQHSMDWFKGKFTGKPYIWWFPVKI